MRKHWSILLSAAVFLSGCWLMQDPKEQERRLSALRPAASRHIIQEMKISRPKLVEALKREQLTRKVRLVQIFNTAAAVSQGTIPLYRLFDIDPKSAYALIGLKNNDVLVAINDRIVVNPDLLSEYVLLLPNETQSQVEIERDGDGIVLKYEVTPD